MSIEFGKVCKSMSKLAVYPLYHKRDIRQCAAVWWFPFLFLWVLILLFQLLLMAFLLQIIEVFQLLRYLFEGFV